jgi:hypothetical protein
MTFIGRFLGILGIAIGLFACIDDSSGDMNGRKHPADPETAHLIGTFQGGNFLAFDLILNTNKMSLNISNPGLDQIDSATYLVRIEYSDHMNVYSAHPAAFEYYGQVNRLLPGETKDLGIIDTLYSQGLPNHPMSATLIKVASRGKTRQNPYAGVYSGTYLYRDTLGRNFLGVLSGWITAQGAFELGLFETSSRNEGQWLKGNLGVDGIIANGIQVSMVNVVVPNADGKGKFQMTSEGVQANLVFTPLEGGTASLTIQLEPFSPR